LGFLVSLVVRKRWLTLAALAILAVGLVLGSVFHLGWLALAALVIGSALGLIQIPIGLRRDLRMIQEDKQADSGDARPR